MCVSYVNNRSDNAPRNVFSLIGLDPSFALTQSHITILCFPKLVPNRSSNSPQHGQR